MAPRAGKPVAILLAVSLLAIGSFGVASAATHPRISIVTPSVSEHLALPVGHTSTGRVAVATAQRRLVRNAMAAAGLRAVPRPPSNEIPVLGSIAGGVPPAGSASAAGPRAPPSIR